MIKQQQLIRQIKRFMYDVDPRVSSIERIADMDCS